ncbi:MAG TPA: FAD-dependent oxidoreductase [Spirochaetota bacterium]|nr:FAD-dependent oxidoreductase [Spirochaetota bacterium]HOM37951.1 FAD-dependent oxidoreductase [Spirochaetota bacterium]HPQ48756.1 FAD-dependent oxidoreductase [Spirochaetota bacterium]
MSYVIIGNGPAAIAACEGIRKYDKDREIIIISKEDQYAYGRPLITYQIAGIVKKEDMYLRRPEFYKENNIKVLLGKEAISIDSKSKTVKISDGSSIGYHKLLIASGGTPFVPPTYKEYLTKENVMTFIKWADMEKLESIIDTIENVLIIGGGLIGIKAAEALVMRGKNVYIAELSKRVLPTVIDDYGSYYFHKELEKNNVGLFLEDTVDSFKIKKNRVEKAVLKSGNTINIDAVIIAIGVKPEISFIDKEIKTNVGIIVDDMMKTSVSDIYAAGDVTECYDIVYGSKRLGPIWVSASEQGRIAGYNMAGANITYRGRLLMNSISFMKTNLTSYGIINPELEYTNVEVFEYKRDDLDIYRRINVVNNRVVGAVFINSIYRKGIITRFMIEGLPFDKYKELLLSPNIGFINFEKEYRVKEINSITGYKKARIV